MALTRSLKLLGRYRQANRSMRCPDGETVPDSDHDTARGAEMVQILTRLFWLFLSSSLSSVISPPCSIETGAKVFRSLDIRSLAKLRHIHYF